MSSTMVRTTHGRSVTVPHGRTRNLSELYVRAYWRTYLIVALWVLIVSGVAPSLLNNAA